ncbi:hypothetical protein ColLi_12165 [Colletotrichum liriopes]|uniref:Ubiquitin-like protease family profile domain-containing protein n=1 Tax=Colletotrichum liriopes TaxID=708192 RepID=A0AA37GZU5_9PEZI|nr:hypothetical protein ColLi_12165 [Colletotrichum liriopes]
MTDGDQDLSSVRINQNSVLYTTLDELNSIDIINIEQHIDTLWKKLRTAFSENTDTSITGTTNFIVWALNNVKRALLCRILEGEHADVIRSYSLDIQGRLSAMAKRWDASPGLFYALFGSQIVGSRAGIEIFNDLLKVQPELLLTDIVYRYIDVPRNDSKRYGPRATKNPLRLLKEAVRHFHFTLARRKQRAAVPHTPSEGAPSTNYGDEDRESISDSDEHQDEPDSGDKHTPDAQQALPADPSSINAKTSGDDAADDARSSAKTPVKQGTKPRRSRFLGTNSLISHLQLNRKRARDEVLSSPEQPRREAQAFPESPQCSELLVTQETNELFYDAGTASQNSDEDKSDLEPFELGFWPGPFGSRDSQRFRSASEELNAEPKFKRRPYSSIGVFQGTNLSPLQEPDVTDSIANWTPPKPDLPVRHEPVTPAQQRPAALKTVRSDSFADQSADVAPAQSKSPASREHSISINQREQSIDIKRESTASAKAACTSITPPGMRSMSGPKYRTMLEEISASAHRLAPGSMLNDSIINTLLHRLSSANTLVVNTLFLESRNVSDRVFKQMTKIQSTEILLPVCRNRHWVLYVFFRQENKVRLFDSLPGIMPVDEIANTVILPFLHRMGVSGEIKIDLDASQCPRQRNDVDCGLFTILFAHHVSGFSESMPTDVTSEMLDAHRRHLGQCLLTSSHAALSPKEFTGIAMLGKRGRDRLVNLARCTIEFVRQRQAFITLFRAEYCPSQPIKDLEKVHSDIKCTWETRFVISALDDTHFHHARLVQHAIMMQVERDKYKKEMRRSHQIRTAIQSLLDNIDPADPTGPFLSQSDAARPLRVKTMMNLRLAADVAADVISESSGLSSEEGEGRGECNPFTICVVHILIARFIRQKL